ncbi:hypothetical protein, partial [Variovorax boronicumulans]|uniref:hypothetical protein n=1 Tax=Variovorax boronicumulans TaxID=436515 RepID=UPI0027D7E88F
DYWMAREAAGGHRDANARHTGAPTAFPHSLGPKLTPMHADSRRSESSSRRENPLARTAVQGQSEAK